MLSAYSLLCIKPYDALDTTRSVMFYRLTHQLCDDNISDSFPQHSCFLFRISFVFFTFIIIIIIGSSSSGSSANFIFRCFPRFQQSFSDSALVFFFFFFSFSSIVAILFNVAKRDTKALHVKSAEPFLVVFVTTFLAN